MRRASIVALGIVLARFPAEICRKIIAERRKTVRRFQSSRLRSDLRREGCFDELNRTNRTNTSMSTKNSRAKKKTEGTAYPESTDSNKMARVAREAVNQMTEEEVEDRFEAAMARIYAGRSAQQASRT